MCTQELEDSEADLLVASSSPVVIVGGRSCCPVFWTRLHLEPSMSKGFAVHPLIFLKSLDGAPQPSVSQRVSEVLNEHVYKYNAVLCLAHVETC